MAIATQNQVTRNYLPQESQDNTAQKNTLENMVSKDQFLKLLVTQLKYQDPLNPMESTAFTAKLAQFTSLEQLYNLNSSFEGLKNAMTSQYNYQAANLIGKSVIASGNTLRVEDTQVLNQGSYILEGPADQVKISIYDKDGILVKTLDEIAAEPGLNAINWDGLGLYDQTVSDGDYTFEVKAYDGIGQIVGAAVYIEGKITGLTFGPGGSTSLLMHGLVIDLADVLEIAEASVVANS